MYVCLLTYDDTSLAQMGDHEDRGVLRAGISVKEFKNVVFFLLRFTEVILSKLIFVINQLYEQLLR